jgi:hypothetical protein
VLRFGDLPIVVILAPLSVFESEGIQLQLSRTGRETGVDVAAANLGEVGVALEIWNSYLIFCVSFRQTPSSKREVQYGRSDGLKDAACRFTVFVSEDSVMSGNKN